MKDRIAIANAMLWAAAIIAAALLNAPTVLTLLLLPGLAVTALLVTTHGGSTQYSEPGTCR